MMKVDEFIKKLKLAASVKSLYVRGCFGAPMTGTNKKRYTKNHSYNKRKDRTEKILAASPDTFGTDCSGLIKACLGYWNANLNHVYGGTVVNQEAKGISYGPDHVPDLDDAGLIKACKDATKDFSNIEPGCLVWMSGHVGIYVGDGKVIESSPSFQDGCQYTYIANLGYKSGNHRTWTKWGHLPWVEYPNKTVKVNVDKTKGSDHSTMEYYTVKKGDILGRIAQKHKISLKEILKLNLEIKDPNKIYPGQKIRIK